MKPSSRPNPRTSRAGAVPRPGTPPRRRPVPRPPPAAPAPRRITSGRRNVPAPRKLRAADDGTWNARRWAAELLMRSDEGAAFGPALLAQVPATMSTVDRALVTELFYGVLRHRAALDWRLAACSQRHLARLAPPTLTLLRVGAYQLLFLSRVPASAAVNETVALTKRLCAPDDVGFVNAVLRALDRRRHELIVPDLLDRPLDHLTAEYSHPVWLVRRWLKRFGVQRTLHLCRANNAIPPMTLRANTLVTTRERLLDVLRQEGVEAAPCAVSPQGAVIRGTPPTATRAFAQGWYYVQDEAAQLVGLAVAPRPGERVLDACAAPGGKSIHLAELMGDHGEVVAADVKPDRLGLVAENCRRMGIKSVQTAAADLTQASDAARLGRFDRILVDAPCTGLGVLRRHPEAKWHKTEGLIARYAATQRAILDRVAPLLTPGGVLIYSTCSTEREENEEIVTEFLRRHRGWVSDDLHAVLPAAAASLVTPQGHLLTLGNAWDMDCFFAARLKLPAASCRESSKGKEGLRPFAR